VHSLGGKVFDFVSSRHQNIAGFDNPGKSLYTTMREFVENGLDAAEAIKKLPEIEIVM
jgi:DNA topoisomerase-6 subunit B